VHALVHIINREFPLRNPLKELAEVLESESRSFSWSVGPASVIFGYY